MLARCEQSSSPLSGWVQAATTVLDSKPLQILLCLILGILVGYQAPNLAVGLFLFVGVASVIALCLLEINWAICLLILLSPFHYAIKELSSSAVVDIWRELLLILIVSTWLLQVFLGRRSFPQNNLLNIVVGAYLVWGVVAILNSASLLVGLAGFRFMFSFLPLYFVATSTIADEADIKRFVWAILASGVIVAVIAIVQFFLVPVLGIVEKGTFIDFARQYAPSSYLAVGIPWDRSNSVLISPNELGVFLAVCIALTFSYYLSAEREKRHPRLLVLLMAIMGVGLLTSMSRSSMLGLAVAFLALSFLKRRIGPLLVMCLVVTLLLAFASLYVEALFGPVYTLSDPYFTTTWQTMLSSTSAWGSPLLGQGYGLTPSVAAKLGIDDPSILTLGGVDIYFAQSILQIGLIGYSLFFLGWLLFVRNAYRGARRAGMSEFMRGTAAGICAAFLGIMATSAHVAAWEYVSFAASYYLLGAIATWVCSVRGRDRMHLP